ncbi:hypothetical protein GGX14DRAFT_566976 [Mycena pura]|uniref:Uncharacterized protein n=1 Tax=Mycena pura TaxID=153505 RepID=A0AAD6YE22_9AGAR|nr:hypothetical protein GGX14DRAFT_566976 [Mycena pura]
MYNVYAPRPDPPPRRATSAPLQHRARPAPRSVPTTSMHTQGGRERGRSGSARVAETSGTEEPAPGTEPGSGWPACERTKRGCDVRAGACPPPQVDPASEVLLLERADLTQAFTHVSANEIQHNPFLPDGAVATFDFVNALLENPAVTVEVLHQAFAAPIGWVHYRIDGVNPEPTAIVDVWRFAWLSIGIQDSFP